MCRGLGTCTGAISTAQLGSGNLLSHGNLPARGGVMERLSPFPASSVSVPSCQGSPSVAPAPAAAGPPLTRARGDSWPALGWGSSGPVPIWAAPQRLCPPHWQLPTPRRCPQGAGAGQGAPGAGLGSGRAGGTSGWQGTGSPGWHPSAGGAGGASLSTGYRGSQDIELSRDVRFIHGGRWEKFVLRMGSHRDLLWGQRGKRHRIHRDFWGDAASAASQCPGNGSYRANRLCCWNRSPSEVLTSRAHLAPPSRSEDSPTAEGCPHP